jgi:hypothetical protein
MAIIDDLAEGRFRLFCSEIRLQRGGAQPFSISGPGSIEINDSGRFEYSIHISADVHHKGFVDEFSRMRPAGTVLRKEDSFSLRGASYDGHIFSGETIDPGTGGALGGPGMVSGTLLELRSVKTVGYRPSVEGDYVTFHLPGTLKFPALTVTETNKTRGGELVNFHATRDYVTFKINEEEFSLSPKAEHVVLNCSFASGVDAIGKNRHLRICEALGFALGQFIIPFAIELEPYRGEHVKILRAPAYMLYTPEKKVDFPPLFFGDDMPIPEVHQIAASHYTKIRNWEVKEEHPLSSGAYRVIEALRQPIELQFLALSVAAEDLIRTAFPDIAPIDIEFANEVQQFLGGKVTRWDFHSG